MFTKIFATTGDRSIKVWTEDVRGSCIMAAASPGGLQMTSARWSPARPSVLLSGREDGQVAVWDLVYSHNSPAIVTKVGDRAVTDIKFNPEGNMAMVSSESGLHFSL